MIARILFLLSAMLGCASPAAAATLQVVSGAYDSGKVYVPALTDGVKERFFVDTGSAMTLVTDSKRYAAYTNLGNFRFVGASGIPQETETIRIQSIKIDDVLFSDLKIGRALFRGAEKTLGIDILGRQPFAIRFEPRAVLELNAKRPELPLTTLDVSPQGLFSIPLEIAGVEGRALWDTGAALTFVDQAFIISHPAHFKPTKNYMNGVDGAGKNLLLQVFRAKRMTIADRTFENVRVVAADLSILRTAHKDIQAVLGFNLIRKGNWFFDAKNRLWKCDR